MHFLHLKNVFCLQALWLQSMRLKGKMRTLLLRRGSIPQYGTWDLPECTSMCLSRELCELSALPQMVHVLADTVVVAVLWDRMCLVSWWEPPSTSLHTGHMYWSWPASQLRGWIWKRKRHLYWSGPVSQSRGWIWDKGTCIIFIPSLSINSTTSRLPKPSSSILAPPIDGHKRLFL